MADSDGMKNVMNMAKGIVGLVLPQEKPGAESPDADTTKIPVIAVGPDPTFDG